MTAATEFQMLAPVVCQPWCETSDGHRNAVTIDDQNCYSAWTGVDLTRAPQGDMGHGEFCPERLEVMLRSGPRRPLSVVLHSEGLDIEVDLTPNEARELADALAAAVELAESTD
jgi:hypothetical protein